MLTVDLGEDSSWTRRYFTEWKSPNFSVEQAIRPRIKLYEGQDLVHCLEISAEALIYFSDGGEFFENIPPWEDKWTFRKINPGFVQLDRLGGSSLICTEKEFKTICTNIAIMVNRVYTMLEEADEEV